MLTSLQNPRVKDWKKLQKRKHRNREGVFLVEGFHLVEEAMNSSFTIKELIVMEGTDFPLPSDLPVTEVSRQVFDAIAETDTPQGIAAIVKQKQWSFTPATNTLMLDAVQDPGNVGTMIRTADAAGFDQVILGTGTVDLYNDKVLRATQGSVFHLPILEGDLSEFAEELKGFGVEIWASTLTNGTPFKELTVPEKVALLVGNEGNGIRDELLNLADKRPYIPIYGKAESLNVAIASAVLMYHVKS